MVSLFFFQDSYHNHSIEENFLPCTQKAMAVEVDITKSVVASDRIFLGRWPKPKPGEIPIRFFLMDMNMILILTYLYISFFFWDMNMMGNMDVLNGLV